MHIKFKCYIFIPNRCFFQWSALCFLLCFQQFSTDEQSNLHLHADIFSVELLRYIGDFLDANPGVKYINSRNMHACVYLNGNVISHNERAFTIEFIGPQFAKLIR